MSDNGLRDRVIVVTGGGQGLGRAYALRLAADGARLAVIDVNPDAALAVQKEIQQAGDEAMAFHADVADEASVTGVMEAVIQRFGQVDVLVNNAGGAFFPTSPFESFSVQQWDQVLNVNLKGQWLCARALAPHLKARAQGRIVNITSTVVHRGYPRGMAPYLAAKAGVIGLTRALAHELGPHGITVNAVAPGYTPVATPKTVHLGDAAAKLRQQMIDEQCLKRSETAEDLADVVAFLASDAARFVTGQVLNVDGGWTMG